MKKQILIMIGVFMLLLIGYKWAQDHKEKVTADRISIISKQYPNSFAIRKVSVSEKSPFSAPTEFDVFPTVNSEAIRVKVNDDSIEVITE